MCIALRRNSIGQRVKRIKIGDLVVSANGHWYDPRLIVEIHKTAKNLIGVFWSNGETRYIHYKHLEVISARH